MPPRPMKSRPQLISMYNLYIQMISYDMISNPMEQQNAMAICVPTWATAKAMTGQFSDPDRIT